MPSNMPPMCPTTPTNSCPTSVGSMPPMPGQGPSPVSFASLNDFYIFKIERKDCVREIFETPSDKSRVK
jgi:hypothetical protein